MWPVYVFNLAAALLIAGLYIHAVRRLERRMDDRMRRYDAWADAEEAKFDEWSDTEEAKWDVARDEIIASMRSRVDASIASDVARTELHLSVGSDEPSMNPTQDRSQLNPDGRQPSDCAIAPPGEPSGTPFTYDPVPLDAPRSLGEAYLDLAHRITPEPRSRMNQTDSSVVRNRTRNPEPRTFDELPPPPDAS